MYNNINSIKNYFSAWRERLIPCTGLTGWAADGGRRVNSLMPRLRDLGQLRSASVVAAVQTSFPNPRFFAVRLVHVLASGKYRKFVPATLHNFPQSSFH